LAGRKISGCEKITSGKGEAKKKKKEEGILRTQNNNRKRDATLKLQENRATRTYFYDLRRNAHQKVPSKLSRASNAKKGVLRDGAGGN